MKNLTYLQFKNFILEHDNSFKPHLSSITEIQSYIDKLYTKGIIFYELKDHALVGFVTGYINNFFDKEAYISLVLVDEKYRSQGIASKLMLEFLNECKRLNFNVIRLEARINNTARYLYEKFGFVEEYRSVDSVHYIFKFDEG